MRSRVASPNSFTAWCSVLCLVLGLAAPSRGEDSGPARTVKAGQTVESVLEGGPGEASPWGASRPGWGSILKLVLGAACVVVLGLGAIFVARRWIPNATRLAAAGGVQVLGRVPLSPRHFVYVLGIGDRKVVVGVSGDRMAALAVLDDSGAPRPAALSPLRPESSMTDKRLAPASKPIEEADLLPYRRQVHRLRELLRDRGNDISADRETT